jgi:hypothetical protein
MILFIDNYGKTVEFGRSNIYRVLFKLEDDNFEGWCNEIIIYKR